MADGVTVVRWRCPLRRRRVPIAVTRAGSARPPILSCLLVPIDPSNPADGAPHGRSRHPRTGLTSRELSRLLRPCQWMFRGLIGRLHCVNLCCRCAPEHCREAAAEVGRCDLIGTANRARDKRFDHQRRKTSGRGLREFRRPWERLPGAARTQPVAPRSPPGAVEQTAGRPGCLPPPGVRAGRSAGRPARPGPGPPRRGATMDTEPRE
jgi:hypothetical protein